MGVGAVPAVGDGPGAVRVRRAASHALIIGSLLIPTGLFAVEAWTGRSAAIKAAKHDSEQTAALLEQQARTVLETYCLVSSMLVEHVRQMSWDEIEASSSLQPFLEELVREHPLITGLALVDAKGDVRVMNGGQGRWAHLADRDYFKAVQGGAETAIGRAVSWLGGRDLLTFARRRSAAGGRFDGAVVATADPEVFNAFWRSMGGEGATTLFRTDGTRLARNPSPSGVEVTGISIHPELLAAAGGAQAGRVFVRSKVDGRDRSVAFRHVGQSSAVIAYGVDLSLVEQAWWDGVLRDALVFGPAEVALLLLVFAMTWAMRRETTMRRALASQAQVLRAEASARERAEAELAEVLRDVVEKQEQERRHIALALHDTLGQHAAVFHLGLDDIMRRATDLEQARHRAAQLKSTAGELSRNISQLAWRIRPVELDDMGLDRALHSLCETTEERSGLPVTLTLATGGCSLPDPVQAILYRAAQEGLTNVIRHSGASRADIMLKVTKERISLVIADDGRGFDCSGSEQRKGGLGLLGMRERLSLVGGTLELESTGDSGTALFIDVPMTAGAA